MNDSAIKNFCIWARGELRRQVRQKLMEWEVVEDASAELDTIGGHPLTAAEKRQRRELLTQLAKLGEDALVERAAYTWFNRLMAIRYIEVNDYLPAHVRLLSNADGSCGSQAVKEALTLDIEGLDRTEVVRLVQQGDDEALFRHLFLAQCDELARCMPVVFEPIGSAMELLLPSGLLRDGSVPDRMVRDIPEEDWRAGVQIVGWMYQYYNAERKDEVFASFKKGKKADAAALAPATQLFTPDWIVRYLVENSLGRLWMRSHPNSTLVDRMPYYIPDEDDAVISTGGAERRSGEISPLSPESITVIDPACGSGHILVYAFDLLVAMYEEEGYALRDIPRLVLENNLTGVEIDPRAAAMASFALTMKGRERDARFLSRGVTPSIVTEVPVKLEGEELALVPDLADRAKLLDAMEHADECGSLFKPEAQDMDAIDEALGRLRESNDLFADSARDKLEQMRANCKPLSRTYDAVVANPPYMGSSSMGRWLADWTKRNNPDSKRDLCTCFIERGFTLADPEGYSAMVTMESWMFLSSYEKLRERILNEKSITTLVYMNHMVMRIAFNTSATVFQNGRSNTPGIFTKVEYQDLDEDNRPEEFPVPRHKIYRRSADAFSAIPGSPIAYWIPRKIIDAYQSGITFKTEGHPKVGMQTSNNDKYLRMWWEISDKKFEGCGLELTWIKYLKGGDYRKWYGNLWYLLHYNNNPDYILQQPHAKVQSLDYLRKCKCTWTDLTSGEPSFRIAPTDSFYDISGHCFLPAESELHYLLAYANTSIVSMMKKMFNSSFHFQVGDLEKIAVPNVGLEKRAEIESIAKSSVSFSKSDWDSFETSWDFQRHPML